eukprot:3575347-Amphidinium_carterae.1
MELSPDVPGADGQSRPSNSAMPPGVGIQLRPRYWFSSGDNSRNEPVREVPCRKLSVLQFGTLSLARELVYAAQPDAASYMAISAMRSNPAPGTSL